MPAGGDRRSSTPRRCEECPRAKFDDEGRLLNPDECIGEIVNKNGAAGVRGLLQERRGQRGPRSATAGTGPATSGTATKQGWFVLRRPRLRVAAGRRRELRRRADRAASSPATPTSCSPRVYAVPDEEVGDQVMATLARAPGHRVRPRGLRRVPRRADRPRHQVVAAVRADHRGHAGHREPEADEAPAPARALGRPTSRCLWRPAKDEPLRPMTDADREPRCGPVRARGDRLAALDVGGERGADPIAGHAASRPEHAAIICNDVVCTYAELDEHAQSPRPRAARRTASARDERVAVMLPNSMRVVRGHRRDRPARRAARAGQLAPQARRARVDPRRQRRARSSSTARRPRRGGARPRLPAVPACSRAPGRRRLRGRARGPSPPSRSPAPGARRRRSCSTRRAPPVARRA